MGGNNYYQGTVSALVGGSVSSISGGKFANGAVTAAMAYAFNQMQSSGDGSTSQDAGRYDDEGYLIGGYSPAAGTYMTDDGLLVDVQINDAGGMTDSSGGYYKYLGDGFVSQYESPALGTVAWEAAFIPVLRAYQMPRYVYHFTSSQAAVSISSSGVIHTSRGLYGTGVYTTRWNVGAVARLQCAQSSQAVIRLPSDGFRRILFPGTYRSPNPVRVPQ